MVGIEKRCMDSLVPHWQWMPTSSLWPQSWMPHPLWVQAGAKSLPSQLTLSWRMCPEPPPTEPRAINRRPTPPAVNMEALAYLRNKTVTHFFLFLFLFFCEAILTSRLSLENDSILDSRLCKLLQSVVALHLVTVSLWWDRRLERRGQRSHRHTQFSTARCDRLSSDLWCQIQQCGIERRLYSYSSNCDERVEWKPRSQANII